MHRKARTSVWILWLGLVFTVLLSAGETQSSDNGTVQWDEEDSVANVHLGLTEESESAHFENEDSSASSQQGSQLQVQSSERLVQAQAYKRKKKARRRRRSTVRLNLPVTPPLPQWTGPVRDGGLIWGPKSDAEVAHVSKAVLTPEQSPLYPTYSPKDDVEIFDAHQLMKGVSTRRRRRSTKSPKADVELLNLYQIPAHLEDAPKLMRVSRLAGTPDREVVDKVSYNTRSPAIPVTFNSSAALSSPTKAVNSVNTSLADDKETKETDVSREEYEEKQTKSPKLDVELVQVPPPASSTSPRPVHQPGSIHPPRELPTTAPPEVEDGLVKTPSVSKPNQPNGSFVPDPPFSATQEFVPPQVTPETFPDTITPVVFLQTAPEVINDTVPEPAPDLTTFPTMVDPLPTNEENPDIPPVSENPDESPRPIVPKCCPPGERVLGQLQDCAKSPLEFIPPFLEYTDELPEETGDTSALTDADGDEGSRCPNELTVTTEAEGYDIIVGNPCGYGRYRLEPAMDSRDEFYLLPNGSLFVPFMFDYPIGPDMFCMDVFPDKDTGQGVVLPLVCFQPPEGQRRSGLAFVLYPIGLFLSVPFLVTTFMVYAMVPALRDVHGKALMCHVGCLTIAYTTLASVHLWGVHLGQSTCFISACIVQFSFIACFLWLNVMCINIWWNMAFRPAEIWCRQTERRRFVLYSMYAWSLPCLLMSVTLVMDLTPTIPSTYIKPRFSIDSCWFQSDDAAFPYFYGPVTALICMNIVLFILTSISVHRQRRVRARDPSARPLTGGTCYQRHTKSAFKSCLILFAAMGINWVMEVVSWLGGGPAYLWYATDILNCLEGVIIFLIFVVSRPARREIRAWYAANRRPRERRVTEVPQIDDFKTVVQRNNRNVPQRLSQWQDVKRKSDG